MCFDKQSKITDMTKPTTIVLYHDNQTNSCLEDYLDIGNYFADFEELFKGVDAFIGYVPNAHLTMSEKPELIKAFSN